MTDSANDSFLLQTNVPGHNTSTNYTVVSDSSQGGKCCDEVEWNRQFTNKGKLLKHM